MRPVSIDLRRRRAAAVAVNFSSAAFTFLALLRKRQLDLENVRGRRWYVRPINVCRPIRSEYHVLVTDFYNYDERQYHHEYFRMSEERLVDLFDRIKHRLEHPKTHAFPIPAALRFSMAIKILASGDSIRNTAKSYRLGYQTAFNILYEVCDALWTVLQPEFLAMPTNDEWLHIADTFWESWNFPLCLGAIDGKHVVIKKPPSSGSKFFNYKLDNSIVLLAVADGDYCFTYVDIGQYGRSSDGGVLRNSTFGKALSKKSKNQLQLPAPTFLPGSTSRQFKSPFVFIGDAAFPISGHMLKPYGGRNRMPSQQLFDYRLSRARRCVENAFGILAARWRILQQPIACAPSNAGKIVKATVVLHNYLRKTDGVTSTEKSYMPTHMIDRIDKDTGIIREGGWRHDLPVGSAFEDMAKSKFRSERGKEIRRRFTKYFLTENGAVPWQWRKFPALRNEDMDE